MICPECKGRKWIGGAIPHLCQTCATEGRILNVEPGSARDRFREEQEDQASWVEAAAFFAVCAALAESSGSPALVEMFRGLWERAGHRANELDEADLEASPISPAGELLKPPVEVWRRR